MARRRAHGLSFVGIDDLDGRPHIVCDGAPRPGTVLTLSHWPATPCPHRLARDLSTEIVFAYLDRPRYWRRDAIAATNDHFDEDGLAGLYALSDPLGASERRDALIDFARAGDFGVAVTVNAARSLFVVQALADEIGTQCRGLSRTGLVAALYAEIIEQFPEILDHPEHFAPRYLAQESALNESRAALSSGRVHLEERPRSGLCVVRVDEDVSFQTPLNFGHDIHLPIHPLSIHEATSSMRILLASSGERAGQPIYYDRYETWVKYLSRRLPPRRDLSKLAVLLGESEPVGATWTADGPGNLVPALRVKDGERSALSTGTVIETLESYLGREPVAWDPFRGSGALEL